MTKPSKADEAKPRKAVGHVLDSRWMMALSVGAVLVAIVWALLDKGPMTTESGEKAASSRLATVELLEPRFVIAWWRKAFRCREDGDAPCSFGQVKPE